MAIAEGVTNISVSPAINYEFCVSYIAFCETQKLNLFFFIPNPGAYILSRSELPLHLRCRDKAAGR
jgi:hypothetical protein